MQTENINWEFIARTIENQKTILFLGHGVSINYQNPKHEAAFFQDFVGQRQADILSYHEQDGFLVFKNHDAKLLSLNKIRPFYEQDFSNPLLEKIADIPFHLIISLTPDLSLKKIFERKQFAHTHQYYRTKIRTEAGESPTKEKPLLYNFLGCVKDEESLITSHYDLFNLVQSIYADKNLPEKITSVFNKELTKNIIFLGFDFEKWYFQLILHLLGINYDSCIRYAASQQNLSEAHQTLIESEFKINFASNDLESFVNTLHSQFSAEKLRKPSAEATKQNRKYLKNNIMKFMAKAFNATDFETFCMINFDEVYDNFTPTQGQSARLNALLDYLERKSDYENFLDLAKEENPVQFKNFAPYYEEQ
ncbi:MAG: hypothetical protein EAZ08_04265 [Cytophagales bacterium]|nr:MAG: hypothetical protein EAZ08_04265 [Cytophagales bacterium]